MVPSWNGEDREMGLKRRNAGQRRGVPKGRMKTWKYDQ